MQTSSNVIVSTGTLNRTMNLWFAGLLIFLLPVNSIFAQAAPKVKIGKAENVLPGNVRVIGITLEDYPLEMGGFDFLIAYDASALAFTGAEPGQLLEDCGWEYFTYRYGADGNCGDACPSGLLRIIAIADTNNGPIHPTCMGPPDTDPHELANMTMMAATDPMLECMMLPINFFWGVCADNSISSVDGEVLYIDHAVYGFEDNLLWDEDDDDQFPEEDRIPFVGAPDTCTIPDEGLTAMTSTRMIDFVNGGIQMSCGACCGIYTGGVSGNANCSADGKLTLSDITREIDRVYVSKLPLCCEASGNTNGSADCKITLSDITALIDAVFVSKLPPAGCMPECER